MSNTLSDFRPGANVTGPDGKQYTVIDTIDNTITVQKKICIIENSNGQRFRIPDEKLTPVGQPAAKIAVYIAGTTLLEGDTVTFITKQAVYKNYTLLKIEKDNLSINNNIETISVDITDIIGISIIY